MTSNVPRNDSLRVLHINDVALAGPTIVETAKQQGLPWDFIDIARPPIGDGTVGRIVGRFVTGVLWAEQVLKKSRIADLLHIHGGTVPRHTDWLRKPYVLHLHGSDVRTQQYDVEYRRLIVGAVEKAERVVYATPDLRDHILDLRDDAELLPVVVDTRTVPNGTPPEEPTVVFPSRWDASKGGELQLEVLSALRDAVPDTRFKGVAWGENWRKAASVGVEMTDRMKHDDYLRWVGNSTVAVGQTIGCLGASELETMATGVPLVATLDPNWYTSSHPSTKDVPVLGGFARAKDRPVAQIVNAVSEALADPRVTNAREWVEEHHGPAQAVIFLQQLYGGIDLREK